MQPFVFMVDVALRKNDEVVKKQFIFASRKEVELFGEAIKPWGGKVTDIHGFFPSTSKSAFGRVMEFLKA